SVLSLFCFSLSMFRFQIRSLLSRSISFPYTTLFRSPLHVLNVASGPARDLREFFLNHPGAEVQFDCVDMDAHAVDYASRLCAPRSEEHTSELQSRENLVCRLLLEKKNNKYT